MLVSIFPIIFPIIFFLIFFVTFFYSNKIKQKSLKTLSNFLNGTVSRFSLLPTFNAEFEGLKISIMLMPASRNSPAYLKIYLTKNSSFKLSIYKESILSQFGKRIGLVREVKTNDEIFDAEFLIFSDKPNPVIAYLNNTNIKNAIRELFIRGFNALFINGKKVWIQKPNYSLPLDLQSQNIMEVLQRMTLIAQGL